MVENPSPERIKIGIADVTDIAQSQGRQKGYEATRQVRHEAKNPQSRLSRFGAVMKNLGSAIANNYLGEFRRERAKQTAVGEMKRSQQLVHDHEGVVRRSIERAVSDLPDEDVLFSDKGERRYSSDENLAAGSVKQKLKDFIHFQVMVRDLDRGRFESGKRALIAEIRQIAERSRDPSMRGILSKDGVFADNLWDVVTELRRAYDDNAYHQDRLDDIDFTLAKMGDVAESKKGITDKILGKISGNRLGALVANSGVLSALTALGVSVGVSAGKIGTSLGANTVLPVVGGAVAGGAVAAVGEARRVEGEAQYLQRERVLNGDTSADMSRNTRVGEIQAGLLEVVDGDIFADALHLATGSGNPDHLFDLLVELKARDELALKGRPTIKNRDSLDLLRARSEALIAIRREGRTDAHIGAEAKKIVEAKSNSTDLGELAREVATKADIMRKLKRKRAAKMGLVTGGSALVVGSLVRYFAGNQIVDHSSTDDFGLPHQDIVPLSGGGSAHTETGYWGDTVWNLRSSGDVKVVFDQTHHTLDIFDGNGHPITDLQDLRLNADGTMPADTLAQIKASGIEVSVPNISHETLGGHYVDVPVEHTVTRQIPISEWLKDQNPTHADGYYFWHNNSAGGTLNELVPQARISGEGVDFNISHMTSAGSFTGDRHLDVTQLMREGKMYLLVAPDPAHPAELVKIPFDKAGHLHLDEDNPLYQVFSKRGEGVGFAGRWWGVGYVENTGGRNIVNTVAALQGSHTFKDVTASVVEKTVQERWVTDTITRAGYEFAKGNPLPEAIGEGAREVGRRMGEALGGAWTIAGGARSPLEKNRTTEHVDGGFENFPPPAPLPPPRIENPIPDVQTTDEALKSSFDALDFSAIDTHGNEISEADRVIYIIPPHSSRFFDFYTRQVLPQTIRYNYLIPNRDRKVTILIESESSGGEISKADLGLDDDRIVLKHYQRGRLDQEMRNLRASPDTQRLAYVDFSNVDGGVVRGGNIARYFGEEPIVEAEIVSSGVRGPETSAPAERWANANAYVGVHQLASPHHGIQDVVRKGVVKRSGQDVMRLVMIDGSGGSLSGEGLGQKEEDRLIAGAMTDIADNVMRSTLSPMGALIDAQTSHLRKRGMDKKPYGTTAIVDIHADGSFDLLTAGDVTVMAWNGRDFRERLHMTMPLPQFTPDISSRFALLNPISNQAFALGSQGLGAPTIVLGEHNLANRITMSIGGEEMIENSKIFAKTRKPGEQYYPDAKFLLIATDGAQMFGRLMRNESDMSVFVDDQLSRLDRGEAGVSTSSVATEIAGFARNRLGDTDDISVMVVDMRAFGG